MSIFGSVSGERFFVVLLGCFILMSTGFVALVCSDDRRRLRERERKRRDYWGYE
jgi:hypothetical protein